MHCTLAMYEVKSMTIHMILSLLLVADDPIPSRPSIAITHSQLFQMRGPVVVVVALHQTPYSPLITTWCRCTRSCSDIVSCSTTMMLTICIGWSSLVGDLHVIGHRRGLCGDRVVGALAGYATASTFSKSVGYLQDK